MSVGESVGIYFTRSLWNGAMPRGTYNAQTSRYSTQFTRFTFFSNTNPGFCNLSRLQPPNTLVCLRRVQTQARNPGTIPVNSPPQRQLVNGMFRIGYNTIQLVHESHDANAKTIFGLAYLSIGSWPRRKKRATKKKKKHTRKQASSGLPSSFKPCSLD